MRAPFRIPVTLCHVRPFLVPHKMRQNNSTTSLLFTFSVKGHLRLPNVHRDLLNLPSTPNIFPE